MTLNKEESFRVFHRTQDGDHLITTYAPGFDYAYTTARWPISEEFNSVSALWSAYFHAVDCKSELPRMKGVSFYSTDEKALQQFDRELIAFENE